MIPDRLARLEVDLGWHHHRSRLLRCGAARKTDREGQREEPGKVSIHGILRSRRSFPRPGKARLEGHDPWPSTSGTKETFRSCTFPASSRWERELGAPARSPRASLGGPWSDSPRHPGSRRLPHRARSRSGPVHRQRGAGRAGRLEKRTLQLGGDVRLLRPRGRVREILEAHRADARVPNVRSRSGGRRLVSLAQERSSARATTAWH